MKKKEIIAILETHGWSCGKDEVGDRYCTLKVDGKEVHILPSADKRSDHFIVCFMSSVSTGEFSEAASFIFGEARTHQPIIVDFASPDEKLVSVSADDILRVAEKAISWACSQDIEAGLAAFRSVLPVDAKGTMPINHLAALAIAGEIERLEGYKRSFDKGDRLGFVPYITADMIDRAIMIAKKHGT